MYRFLYRVSLLLCVILHWHPYASADEARFRITFVGSWTQQPLPGGAHFSPLIGATHKNAGQIFTVGGFASEGVEDVAEIGQNAALIAEINAGINADLIGSLISRPGNVGSAATVELEFSTTTEFPLLTFLTMIAPSPDWFVAVNDINLQDREGNWIDSLVLDLNSYDAGTENGINFTTSNPATVPQETIQPLDQAEPNNPLFGEGSIARITITRLNATPNRHTTVSGTTLNGSVTDVLCSDDQYLALVPTPISLANPTPVSSIFESALPADKSSFSLNIESSSSTSNTSQSTELFNHNTQTFEPVDTTSVSFADATRMITPTGDTSRFVGKNGEVTLRLSWTAEGLVLTFPWIVRVDRIEFEIEP